jgi:hydrogenase-4 component F
VNLLYWTLAVPLLTAGLAAIDSRPRVRETVMVGGLALTFALSLGVAAAFLDGVTLTAIDGALRVDGLSALVLVLCSFVGLLSGAYGIGYLRRNEARNLVTPRQRTEFYGLMPAYVFTMLLVAVSNNLGVMWVAVELTTLTSVFLIAFHDRKTSLEAAWKFLVLGSIGLAFALFGTVLLFASGQGQLGDGMAALHWTRFMEVAPRLHPYTLRLGVVFALIGYGTKAGLAPMHTWKPDAYREAPSPAVVLMAVSMVNAALYCVLRIHLISSAALGPGFSGGLLLTLGLVSVLIAVPFILIQWNIKRLLAYSSIEHIGIMAIGLGLGAKAAVFGALLHMTYYSIAKPVSLFSAGTLAQLHSSSDFDRIGTGTFTRAPIASALLVLSAIMITGSPPFGLFFSEMTILKAGFLGPHARVTAFFLGALIVLFCGFAYQVGRVVLGPPRDPRDRRVPRPERFDVGTITVIAAAALAIVSAFYLPGPLMALIDAATRVVWGTR